jgi:DNA-nicking Smr family endonuclease
LLSDDLATVGMASGEVLAYLRDGYPPKLLRQLRRGQFVVEAELDLHHLRLQQARALLGAFVAECRRDRRRCIRIIHGKGRGNEHGSVIKAMADRVLRQRADVIGFTSARVQDGGTGAVLVLLQPPA